MQQRITKMVRISKKDRMTGCVITRCTCGLFQYISDEVEAIPGALECECGRPFAYIDEFGNIYQIVQLIRRGVDRRV